MDVQFDKMQKHERLREVIRKAIVTGKYHAGEQLETEQMMCDRFGVSRSTVREAISSLIHEGLLTRVQGKGSYVAENINRHLTIALLIPDLLHQGQSQYNVFARTTARIIYYAEEEARANGAGLMLYFDHNDVSIERENLLTILDRKPDGAIVYYIGGPKNLDCLQKIQDAGIPLVLVDRHLDGFDSHYVVTDNFKGAYELTSLLIEKEYSPVIHFTNQEMASSVIDRDAGYEQAMADMGLSDKVMIVTCPEADDTAESAYQSAMDMLKDLPARCGISCVNASILDGVSRAIYDSGTDMSQLAFGCFDNPPSDLPNGVFLAQQIQPLEEMGRRSIQIIMDAISGKNILQRTMLSPVTQTSLCEGNKLVGVD